MHHQTIPARVWRSITVLMTMVMTLSAGTFAYAEHDGSTDWRKAEWNNEHVIVFSECNFSGNFKMVPAGDYRAMDRIGVDQDAVSSILIPSGMAVEIFDRGWFDGHWYRLNQTQSCLRGNWNNAIGSMRVVEDDVTNSFGFSDLYKGKDKRCIPFTVRTDGGAGGYRLIDTEQRRFSRVTGHNVAEGEICDQRSLRVELAKRDKNAMVMMTVAGKDYQFQPGDRFDDYRRGWYTRIMQVDLPRYRGGRNKGKYGHGNWGNTRGFGKRYSSGVRTGRNWGNDYPANWHKTADREDPDRDGTPHRNCESYQVTANDQYTGIRFLSGDQAFHRVGDGSITGEWCEKGPVTVELSKRSPSATLVLRIDDQRYTFHANERADRIRSGWYRKYVTVNTD